MAEQESDAMIASRFSKLASTAANMMGHWLAFTLACVVVVGWAIVGVFVGYGNTLFELAINTGTTICTFILMFLVQHTAIKESKAMNAKTDELLRAIDAARNEFIGLERQPEEDIESLSDSIAIIEQETHDAHP